MFKTSRLPDGGQRLQLYLQSGMTLRLGKTSPKQSNRLKDFKGACHGLMVEQLESRLHQMPSQHLEYGRCSCRVFVVDFYVIYQS